MTKPGLKSLLNERGLRLAGAAARVGVTRATLTRWAQGQVPAERAHALAEATGIPLHDLRPDLWPREAAQ